LGTNDEPVMLQARLLFLSLMFHLTIDDDLLHRALSHPRDATTQFEP
jgi:hypothetical protein